MTNVDPKSEAKSGGWYSRSRLSIIVLVLVAIALFSSLIISGGTMFAGTRPTNLGITNGKLASCPGSPNCVNSQSAGALDKIAPLTYTDSKIAAMARLTAVINSLPRTKVITQTEDYLYAEFTTALMKFVDDVEFYAEDNSKVIHLRSASRLGQSDLGANRDRLEAIRAKFNS